MSGFPINYSNYPPGVSDNDPYFNDESEPEEEERPLLCGCTESQPCPEHAPPAIEAPPLRSLTEAAEAKEWIVVATVVDAPFANRFYWTRDDPGYSSHPELAMRLTREKAEYIADDNNREGFSAYDAKWHWTVENVNAVPVHMENPAASFAD